MQLLRIGIMTDSLVTIKAIRGIKTQSVTIGESRNALLSLAERNGVMATESRGQPIKQKKTEDLQ